MKIFIKLGITLALGFSLANAKDFRMSLEELNNNISSVTILDARSSNDYGLKHITNALNFPALLTFNNLKEDGRISSANKIQKAVRKLGLKKDDEIVIYDGGSFYDAARLFWTLEVYGFENIKLLDSTYANWIAKGYPTSQDIIEVKPSKYIASVNNKRLATKFATQIATMNPDQIIVDARGSSSYQGVQSIAQRFGHIPNAINLPASHNIKHATNDKAILHDTKTLGKLYSGLDKSKKIILYCAVGKISATNYFALRELGFDVANYDASWKQWGNSKLPIINLSKK